MTAHEGKWTRGKWEQAGAHVGNRGYGEIAECFGTDFEANAHLIAAAPAMYEALESLLNMVTDNRTHGDEVFKAAEVLAKARGDCGICGANHATYEHVNEVPPR